MWIFLFSARNILLMSVCGSSTGPVPSTGSQRFRAAVLRDNGLRKHSSPRPQGVKKTDGKIGMNPVPDC